MLQERPVRDGILSRDDIVSFHLEKWNTCRTIAISKWGESK